MTHQELIALGLEASYQQPQRIVGLSDPCFKADQILIGIRVKALKYDGPLYCDFIFYFDRAAIGCRAIAKAMSSGAWRFISVSQAPPHLQDLARTMALDATNSLHSTANPPWLG